MKFIRTFLSEHKHFYSLLYMLPLLVWFKLIEHYLVPKYIIHSTLDDKIPFLKIFVLPYVIWFVYVAFGLIYTGIESKESFYKLYIFLSAGMSICYILYMLFPNAQNLRPMITEKDFLSQYVKFIYATDTPTNVCPSIHVLNSIAVDAALHNSPYLDSKKWCRTISSALSILIILSTVFIKQHSIIDVAAGIILAAILYIPIYGVANMKQSLSMKRVANKDSI